MGSPLAFVSLISQRMIAVNPSDGKKDTAGLNPIDTYVKLGRSRLDNLLFYIGNFFITMSRIHLNPNRTEKDPVPGKDRVEKDPVPGKDKVEKDPAPNKKLYSPDIKDGTGERNPNKKIEEPGRFSHRIPSQYKIPREKISKMA